MTTRRPRCQTPRRQIAARFAARRQSPPSSSRCDRPPAASRNSAAAGRARPGAANLVQVVGVHDDDGHASGGQPAERPPARSIRRPVVGTKQPCLLALMSTAASIERRFRIDQQRVDDALGGHAPDDHHGAAGCSASWRATAATPQWSPAPAPRRPPPRSRPASATRGALPSCPLPPAMPSIQRYWPSKRDAAFDRREAGARQHLPQAGLAEVVAVFVAEVPERPVLDDPERSGTSRRTARRADRRWRLAQASARSAPDAGMCSSTCRHRKSDGAASSCDSSKTPLISRTRPSASASRRAAPDRRRAHGTAATRGPAP